LDQCPQVNIGIFPFYQYKNWTCHRYHTSETEKKHDGESDQKVTDISETTVTKETKTVVDEKSTGFPILFRTKYAPSLVKNPLKDVDSSVHQDVTQ
jgi:hypothetical protein